MVGAGGGLGPEVGRDEHRPVARHHGEHVVEYGDADGVAGDHASRGQALGKGFEQRVVTTEQDYGATFKVGVGDLGFGGKRIAAVYDK